MLLNNKIKYLDRTGSFKNNSKTSTFETVTKISNMVTLLEENFTTFLNKNTKNSETSNSNNLFIYVIIGVSSIIAIGIFIKLLRRLV